MNVQIPSGSVARLKRIQEIKGYDEVQALNFAISVGWTIAEKKEARKRKREENAGPVHLFIDVSGE